MSYSPVFPSFLYSLLFLKTTHPSICLSPLHEKMKMMKIPSSHYVDIKLYIYIYYICSSCIMYMFRPLSSLFYFNFFFFWNSFTLLLLSYFFFLLKNANFFLFLLCSVFFPVCVWARVSVCASVSVLFVSGRAVRTRDLWVGITWFCSEKGAELDRYHECLIIFLYPPIARVGKA